MITKCNLKVTKKHNDFCFLKEIVVLYVKNIVLKSITPFFWNGVLSTFGLSWKVVVASEVLSLPANAVGTILQNLLVISEHDAPKFQRDNFLPLIPCFIFSKQFKF